jgi:DNA-binding MarR family transcriptional regulator
LDDTLADFPHDIRSHVVFRMSLFATITDRGGKNSFYNAFGLSLREYRILAVIAYMQPVSLGDLVDECFLDKGQVSRNVSKLVEDGLVTRSIKGETSERGGQLHLTKAGEALYKKALKMGDVFNDHLMSGLNTEQREALSQALDILVENARDAVTWAEANNDDPKAR